MNTKQNVKKLLRDLTNLESCIFTAKEKAEVDRFTQVGEYGLALETAVDIYAEENKEPTEDFVSKVIQVAEALEMETLPLVSKMHTKH